jgi:hypothetical protein
MTQVCVPIDGGQQRIDVVCHQRVEEALMLVCNGVFLAVGRCVAPEVRADPRLDDAPELQAMVAPGPVDDELVKGNVRVSQSVGVAGVGGGPHIGNEPLQLCVVIRRQELRRFEEREALDYHANGDEHLLDLILSHVGDDGASVRRLDDESLGLELGEGFADRTVAGA